MGETDHNEPATPTKRRNVRPSGKAAPVTKRPHSWEISDPSARKKAAIGVFQQLEMMPTPPETAADREFFGTELWRFVRLSFTEKLSDTDLALWQALPKQIPEKDHHSLQIHQKALNIHRAFDVYLAEQFTIWGWRLFMCREVLVRFAQWDFHDTGLLERTCKSLVRRAKVLQGQVGGRVPVRGEEIRRIEELLVPELRILFRKVRKGFGKRKSDRTNPNLVEFIRKEIEDRRQDYRVCIENLSNILGFVGSCEANYAYNVWSGRISPERFLHSVLERTTGQSWRSLRRLKS
jgi:hypothetical protein